MAQIKYNDITVDTEKNSITWNSITIPSHICANIHFAYLYMSTAQRLIDDYGISDEDAWNQAILIRTYMENTGCSESDAIWEYMKHWS